MTFFLPVHQNSKHTVSDNDDELGSNAYKKITKCFYKKINQY
jgi:hypothetical protein